MKPASLINLSPISEGHTLSQQAFLELVDKSLRPPSVAHHLEDPKLCMRFIQIL